MTNEQLAVLVAADETGGTVGEAETGGDEGEMWEYPYSPTIEAFRVFLHACDELLDIIMEPIAKVGEAVLDWLCFWWGPQQGGSAVVGTLVMNPDVVREMG